MKSLQIFAVIILSLLLSLPCSAQIHGTATSSDGTHIAYTVFGSGKPLLIINGGPGMNSDGFQSLASDLARNYQTILYDQRGTGKSSLAHLDSSTITMKLMLDDIECIRKQLKIESWAVLGHSFGGIMASYYATQDPGTIDKIILSSSGGIDLDLLNYVQASINSKLGKAEQDSVAYWAKQISDGDTSHYARLQRGMHLAPAYVIDKKFIPVIAERLTQSNPTVNMLVWNDLQGIHYDCSDKLAAFTKPVLIIQGKQDIIKAETAEKAHRAFKNSKVVLLEHSIHYGWLDNKERYFTEIRSFLGS